MNPAQARIILEVPEDCADGDHARAVRAAYAVAVKADHPDHGGDGTHLATLKVARDALLAQGAVAPCILCRGVGYTRGRFGVQACTACKGSGDRT